jgi:hypothetical protein
MGLLTTGPSNIVARDARYDGVTTNGPLPICTLVHDTRPGSD